jgi:DNA-binding GntR family transcriptional regulator
MADDKALEQEVEQALRSGDPEGAARAIMQHRSCSLDTARKEVAERLKTRRK